jgi:hypothetical protein
MKPHDENIWAVDAMRVHCSGASEGSELVVTGSSDKTMKLVDVNAVDDQRAVVRTYLGHQSTTASLPSTSR